VRRICCTGRARCDAEVGSHDVLVVMLRWRAVSPLPWPLRRSDSVALSRRDPPSDRVWMVTRARRGDGTASAVLTG
jgi:hypothetical protein